MGGEKCTVLGLRLMHKLAMSRKSWFVKIFLWRRHALMVEDGAFSNNIDYFNLFLGDSKS